MCQRYMVHSKHSNLYCWQCQYISDNCRCSLTCIAIGMFCAKPCTGRWREPWWWLYWYTLLTVCLRLILPFLYTQTRMGPSFACLCQMPGLVETLQLCQHSAMCTTSLAHLSLHKQKAEWDIWNNFDTLPAVPHHSTRTPYISMQSAESWLWHHAALLCAALPIVLKS